MNLPCVAPAGGGYVVGVAGCLAATWLLPRADIVIGIPLAYAAAYTAGLIAPPSCAAGSAASTATGC